MARFEPSGETSLQTQHLQGVLPAKFVWPPESSIDVESQDILVGSTLHAVPAETSAGRREEARLLRALQARLERAGREVSEVVMNDYIERITSTKSTSGSSYAASGSTVGTESIVRRAYPLGYDEHSGRLQFVVLEEDSVQISRGTTGLVVWPAALRLTEYIVNRTTSNGSSFRDKIVLELGAGVGLASIATRFLGCRKVVTTDVDDNVLARLQRNLDNNTNTTTLPKTTNELISKPQCEKVSNPFSEMTVTYPEAPSSNTSCPYEVQRLDWATVTQDEISSINPDIVLCADIIYSPELVPILVRTLLLAFKCNPSCEVIVSATVRQESTLQLFLDTCQDKGITVADTCEQEGQPLRMFWFPDNDDIKLYRLAINTS